LEIINYTDITKIHAKQAVTIGVFDGFHKGHQMIISETLRLAAESGLEPAAITFEHHLKTPEYLTTFEEKLSFLEESGFTRVIILPPDGNWKEWSPEEFLVKFLREKLNTSCLVIGSDFKFGKNRTGNIELLNKYSSADFKVYSLTLEMSKGKKISSSDIRDLVRKGEIEKASEYLGRHYSFTGTVIHGKQIGHKLGFPTINFNVNPEKILPSGVFLAEAVFQDNSRKPAACFIGYVDNREIPEKTFNVELHLFDYTEGDEDRIRGAELIKKFRDPMKFDNLAELREKITEDISEIKNACASE
jgi:riboflavin kinase/FMN adenylyltransferase